MLGQILPFEGMVETQEEPPEPEQFVSLVDDPTHL